MVLVTGGTGLLGSHLLYDLVLSGTKVRAIKRPNSNLLPVKKIFTLYAPGDSGLFDRIEWVNGDVLDVYSLSEAMDGIEQLYHCATIVSFNLKDRAQMLKTNIEGTANVMNMALEKGIKKALHVSSIAALGRYHTKGMITEENGWKASSLNSYYSISKYSAEREAWRATEEGLNTIIINPSIIIGPGNWEKSSANMFASAYKGIKYYASGVCGFVDVRDVSKCMIGLMNISIANERFIISSENYSYKDFFDLAHDFFGTRKPYKQAGPLLSGIAWRLEKLRNGLTGSSSLITRETVHAAHSKQFFSNEKIKKTLGIEFIPVGQSINETCAFFLRDHKLLNTN